MWFVFILLLFFTSPKNWYIHSRIARTELHATNTRWKQSQEKRSTALPNGFWLNEAVGIEILLLYDELRKNWIEEKKSSVYCGIEKSYEREATKKSGKWNDEMSEERCWKQIFTLVKWWMIHRAFFLLGKAYDCSFYISIRKCAVENHQYIAPSN